MPFEKGKSGNPAKVFSSEQQPKKNGRHKGVPNRSTLLKKWLGVKVDLKQLPPGTQEKKGTVEDQIILALINKGVKGDIPAIKEILDSVHGKITDKSEITAEVKHVVFEAIDGSSSDENPDE